MNEPRFIVILYSKYSQECKKIIHLLDSENIDFISRLCIDNPDVREKVQNSTRFNIEFVPCVMVAYDNGLVEKFESNYATDWVKEIINRNRVVDNTEANVQTSASIKGKTLINEVLPLNEDQTPLSHDEPFSDEFNQQSLNDDNLRQIQDPIEINRNQSLNQPQLTKKLNISAILANAEKTVEGRDQSGNQTFGGNRLNNSMGNRPSDIGPKGSRPNV